MLGNPFKKYRKKYKDLYAMLYALQEQRNSECEGSLKAAHLETEIRLLNEVISRFVEDEYARAVFEFYNKRKPMLVRSSTGEVTAWDVAFGNDFNAVARNLRYAIIGLVDGDGRYRLK